jgi:hypothetical protein
MKIDKVKISGLEQLPDGVDVAGILALGSDGKSYRAEYSDPAEVDDSIAEAISVSEEVLSNKIDAEQTRAEGAEQALDGRATAVETAVGQHTTDIAANSANIAALQGRGGSIPATGFGTDDPSTDAMQQAFTQYAAQVIWGAGGTFTWNSADPASSTYVLSDGTTTHTAGEIFNSTWTRNTDNGHRVVLNNTQDTDPKVFEWADVGADTVNMATSATAGIVLSDEPSNEKAEFTVDPSTGKVTISETVTAPATITESVSKFTGGTLWALKALGTALIGKINGIIQKINTVKTVAGQSIWGTGDIPLAATKIVTIPDFNSYNMADTGLAVGESCGFTSPYNANGKPFMSATAGSNDPLSGIYYWAGTITRIYDNYYMLTAYGQTTASLATPHVATRVYNGSTEYDWHISTDYAYKSTSGYVKLPSGIMMQWGSMTGGATFTFPLTFYSGAYQVFLTSNNPSDNTPCVHQVTSLSSSTCQVSSSYIGNNNSANGPTTTPFRWLAIGTWR